MEEKPWEARAESPSQEQAAAGYADVVQEMLHEEGAPDDVVRAVAAAQVNEAIAVEGREPDVEVTLHPDSAGGGGEAEVAPISELTDWMLERSRQ